MLELHLVMPQLLSNESASPEKKEIAINGNLKNGELMNGEMKSGDLMNGEMKNGEPKLQFDSIADTVEAFSMMFPTHHQSLLALGSFSRLLVI